MADPQMPRGNHITYASARPYETLLTKELLDSARELVESDGEYLGRIKRSHHLLLLQGQCRFGLPDSTIENDLKRSRDFERLDRIVLAIPDVAD